MSRLKVESPYQSGIVADWALNWGRYGSLGDAGFQVIEGFLRSIFTLLSTELIQLAAKAHKTNATKYASAVALIEKE